MRTLLTASLLTLALTSAILAVPPDAAPIQPGTGHPFACGDYSSGKVLLVSADGKVHWEYPAPHCNDLWVLPNGNLLFVTGHGVKEVDRQQQVVFSYESKSEIYACQRLADGNTFIAECNAGRLIEVDPKGKVVKQIRLLPEGQDGGHAYHAQRPAVGQRPLPGGPLRPGSCPRVRRRGQAGPRDRRPRRSAQCDPPAQRQYAHRLRRPGNNEPAHVFEVDPQGKSVWQVTSEDLPGIRLAFMTGLQRLPNGNTVMTNWLGHGRLGTAPHVIEVTPQKKVVWTFADHETMKTIATIQLLDVPGDVTRGEILH